MGDLTCFFPVSWSADPARGFGECHVTLFYDDIGQPPASLRIDEADPRILLPDAVRYQLKRALPSTSGTELISLAGDVLRIAGEDRTVIYRLGERLPHIACCVAEWPD